MNYVNWLSLSRTHRIYIDTYDSYEDQRIKSHVYLTIFSSLILIILGSEFLLFIIMGLRIAAIVLILLMVVGWVVYKKCIKNKFQRSFAIWNLQGNGKIFFYDFQELAKLNAKKVFEDRAPKNNRA